MKKFSSFFMLFLLVFAVLLTCVLLDTGKIVAAPKFRVGMTVQDLSNQIWAATAAELKKIIKAEGGEFIVVDSSNNAGQQVNQIENFIASGVDALIVHPVEKNSVEKPLARARENGVKVFCWDEKIENADLCWLIDNYKIGQMVGKYAADWINEKLGGKAEVGILNYPQMEILLARGNGIVDGLKENAPGAEIVAESSAINPVEGINKTETFLQAHPDMKVICAIGGGGAVGANEGVKAAGKLSKDFGIFAVDGTDQELEAMVNDEAIRMSVLNTGKPPKMAEVIYGYLEKMMAGEEVPHIVYREMIPVTKENVDKYIQRNN
ncbi:MAG: sugar ABC transporter substrate-binding protein [Firmicutes bacterium]|nr:sugar ABC transporter substrate-binding protein [Bacillota bacterium]